MGWTGLVIETDRHMRSIHDAFRSCMASVLCCYPLSVILGAMSPSKCDDLWRTRLCKYGPGCKHRGRGFAHGLSELLPPDESRRHYPKVWQGGVDRWYGQNETDDQLSLIQYYHDQTPICDLPQ